MKEYNIGPVRGIFAAAGKWVQSYFYGFLLFRFFLFIYSGILYYKNTAGIYIMYNTSISDGSGGGVVFFLEYIII